MPWPKKAATSDATAASGVHADDVVIAGLVDATSTGAVLTVAADCVAPSELPFAIVCEVSDGDNALREESVESVCDALSVADVDAFERPVCAGVEPLEPDDPVDADTWPVVGLAKSDVFPLALDATCPEPLGRRVCGSLVVGRCAAGVPAVPVPPAASLPADVPGVPT